jgi:hypothetical protein
VSEKILVDVTDAAKILSMTPGQLRRKAKDGSIPCIEANQGQYLFSPEVLRVWAISKSCSISEEHKGLELKVVGTFNDDALRVLAELLVDLAEAEQDKVENKGASSDGQS